MLLVLGPACVHRSHHLPADRPLSGGLTVCLHVVGRVVMLLLQGLACSMHCKLGCFAWRLAVDFRSYFSLQLWKYLIGFFAAPQDVRSRDVPGGNWSDFGLLP